MIYNMIYKSIIKNYITYFSYLIIYYFHLI